MLDRVNANGPFADGRGALDRFQMLDLGVDRRFFRQVFALKLDPVSNGAGCNLRVTFSPVCKEVPLKPAVLASVC